MQAAPNLEANEVPIGERIAGRWFVTRLIGRGGMGVVLEARDGDERVAVKLLHARHLDNAEAVTRFVAEGRAAAKIRGRHAVRLFDMGSHADGRPFLVMELLDGQDLATMLDEGRVPLALATLYVLQACEGMAEVHAHGIVHRDLKPSNLFLARDEAGEPIVKVLDFGIAKGALAIDDPAAHALTQTLVAMGTPLYMSPEQIRSSKNVDARSDVWSLGAIFYELLTGAAPFSGNTVTHITAQVLEANPQPPSTIVPGLPRAIDAIVAKALAKRPEDRYVDVAALAAALEPFAGAAGAGASTRCATLLRGALRPDGGAITQPAIHDDPLGGTTRFTVKLARRRAWIPILAVGVFGLAMGALAWRSRGTVEPTTDASASTPTASARATVDAAEGPANVTAASIPSAVGSTVVLDASLAAPSAKAPPATTNARGAVAPSPRPATAPAPSVRTVAPKPPANAEPFDPFGERN